MSELKKCDVCKKNRATVHVTQIIKNNVTKTHQCEECNLAQEPFPHELLAAIFPPHKQVAGGEVPDALAEVRGGREAGKTCENCGLTFEEFKRFGRLGCTEDYTVFKSSLDTILERIHKTIVHVGRVPPNIDATDSMKVELRTLERALEVAKEKEAYEEAAKLRDTIRELRGKLHGAS